MRWLRVKVDTIADLYIILEPPDLGDGVSASDGTGEAMVISHGQVDGNWTSGELSQSWNDNEFRIEK